jgi:TfoX/Sxy family transcriptional regulator of competence genes
MAYDEGLAQRLRDALASRPGVSEKRMFGGLAFLLHGRMCVGIVGDELMVRVGAEAHATLVREPHARPMDFTGRPMKGFLYVGTDGFESDEDLERWVARGETGAAAAAKSGPRRDAPRRRSRA